jgi:uncharacterized protein YbbK (DUF523 family)
MKVCVSACLLGKNCKYNGGNNFTEAVVQFLKDKTVVSVCPEQLGGLPTPRVPSEIVHDSSEQDSVKSSDAPLQKNHTAAPGRVMNKEGELVDGAFRTGAALAAKRAVDEGVTLAVLKANSPSCGVHHVYDGTFTGTIIEGKGVFAELLESYGIKVIDEDDVAQNA